MVATTALIYVTPLVTMELPLRYVMLPVTFMVSGQVRVPLPEANRTVTVHPVSHPARAPVP
jgi:hypothetical protein